MRKRSAGWIVGRSVCLLLISGLIGATLVPNSPDFGVDETALDQRLSAETIQVREAARAGERNPLTFYARFLRGWSMAMSRLSSPPRWRPRRDASTAQPKGEWT